MSYGCGNPEIGPCVSWTRFADLSDRLVAAEQEIERLKAEAESLEALADGLWSSGGWNND